METLWCYWSIEAVDIKSKKFDREVTLWAWLGRIAPMTALLVLALATTTEYDDYTDVLVTGIAVTFGTIAFFWWWWVLRSVGILTNLLDSTSERFSEVVKELKEIRKDVKDLPVKKTTPKRKYERKPKSQS